MKISRRELSLLTLAAGLTASCGREGNTMDVETSSGQIVPPSANDLKSKLQKGHPRLIVTDAEVARLHQYIKPDSSLAAKYLIDVQAAGEKILTEPTVEYKLVGPRLLDQSRRCLSRMYTLGALYRLEGDKKWSDRAVKELTAAAAFKDWNPSHFLDVAEMTHAFAVGYDWLYAALTDAERQMIRTAIVEKGLKRGAEAYRGEQPWKWWTTVKHNWNQVCNGGLICGALAVLDEEPELGTFIIQSALKSLPLAMASYGPTGGWDEGPGYWSYTTQYTVALIAALQTALGTDFGVGTAHGFDNTGMYRLDFVGPTGRAFNFADAGDSAGDAPWLWWLARRFNRPLYRWEAVRATKTGSALDLLWYDPEITTPKSAGIPLDSHWQGVEVAFLRSTWEDPNALWVGFKSGDNAANHSHLELGTFVFDALGERWVQELGSDNYNLPAYFGKERWNYYRLKTEGQNTLLLDGANQDPKAKSTITAFGSESTYSFAVADLTAAYKPAGATRVQRGIALGGKRQALLIQDEFTAAQPVAYRWQIHTAAQVVADGPTATLTRNGKRLTARILAPENAAFRTMNATPPPLNGGEGPQQNPNKGITKLVIDLPNKVTEARVVVLLTPGDGPTTSEIKPLSEWKVPVATPTTQTASKKEIPVYPKAKELDWESLTAVGGGGAMTHWYHTPDDVKTVVDYYRGLYGVSGYKALPDGAEWSFPNDDAKTSKGVSVEIRPATAVTLRGGKEAPKTGTTVVIRSWYFPKSKSPASGKP